MSLPVPSQRTWSVSDLVTAAEMNANVRDAINFVINPPMFIGHQATPQSIGSGSFVNVALDTNDLDTYSGHSTTVNNTQYFSQLAGIYSVTCSSGWAAAANRRLMNTASGAGATLLGTGTQVEIPNNNTGTVSLLSVCYFRLPVSAWVQMQVQQISGGSLNLGSASMTVEWIHS